MLFDDTDVFHVHAFFAVGFWCEECDYELEIASEQTPPSDEWCVEAAEQARARGWRLPAPALDGTMDFMTAFCPACASIRAGLVG